MKNSSDAWVSLFTRDEVTVDAYSPVRERGDKKRIQGMINEEENMKT